MKITKSQLIASAAILTAATTIIGYQMRNTSVAATNMELPKGLAPEVIKAFEDRPELPKNPVSTGLEEARKLEDKTIVFHDQPFVLNTGNKIDLALDRFVMEGAKKNSLLQFPAVNSPEELVIKMRQVQKETGNTPLLVGYRHLNLRVPENMVTISDKLLVKSTDHEATKLAAEELGLSFLRVSPASKDYLVFDTTDGSPLSAIEAAKSMRSVASVARADLSVGRQQHRMATVNDPLYRHQWHLKNTGQANSTPGEDANVENAWEIAVGSGVVIGIVDDGVQHNHPDLSPNLAGFHIDTTESVFTYLAGAIVGVAELDQDTTPDDEEIDDNHGTAVAGVAAARGNNGIGLTGAAPYAKISAVRVGFGRDGNLNGSDGPEIMGISQTWDSDRTHIKNNSWGTSTVFSFADDGGIFMDSITLAGTTGRGGLGTVITKAAGNSRSSGNQAIKEGWQNHPFVIPIAALSNRGGHTAYSDFGPQIVVGASSGNSSQSQIATTDRTGALGYNTGSSAGEFPDSAYTNTFSGTSSACPLASGCIALMLQANPALNTRDIKEILMRTASRTDIDARGWIFRDGYRSDIAPIKHHHDYGGGRLDAAAAVAMARDWTLLGPVSTISRSLANSRSLDGGIVFDFKTDPTMRVEHVMLEFPEVAVTEKDKNGKDIVVIYPGLEYDFYSDMDIQVIAPDGSVSIMLYADESNAGQQFGRVPIEIPDGFYMTSVRHWGVASKGTNNLGVWTVKISDPVFNYYWDDKEKVFVDLGYTLRDAQLTLSGSTLQSQVPSDIFISEYDFGTQPVGNDFKRTFNIENKGGNPFFVESVSFVGDGVFTGDFSGQVPGNSIRSFDVTFSPTSANNFEATLSIRSTAELGLSYVTIKGAGSAVSAPTFTTPANLNVRASSTVSIPIDSNHAVSFSQKGLPRGMSIDSKSGAITGSSSVPGTYKVTITAANPWGSSSSHFTLVIDPVVTSLVGDYTLNVSRAGEVNENYGGIAQLKVMANGSYSGTIVLGKQTIPVRGFASGSSAGNPKIDQVIKTSNSSIFRLILEFLPNQTVTGGLSFNIQGSEVATLSGWRNNWSAGNYPTPGVFNHRVSLDAANVGNLVIPQGHGFYSQTVSNRGKASSVGVTSDGQRFTSLSDIGGSGQFLVWSLTHARNGVFQATGNINGSAATGTGYAIKGLFEPRTARMYRNGFGITPLVTLVTSGGRYIAPTTTSTYFGKALGGKALISFAQANIETSQTKPNTEITLGALGATTVSLAGSAQNPSGLSIRINARNGMVTGSMTLTDANRIEPIFPFKRVVSFNGIVEPSMNAAYGYFVLNQLPPLKGLPIPLNKTELLVGSWILQ